MFILRKVVGYVFILITLIMISACSTYSNPGFEITTYLDYEKYMDQGVFVTPLSYEGDYTPKGIVHAYSKDSIFESNKQLQTYQANKILKFTQGELYRKRLVDIKKENIIYNRQTYWNSIIVRSELQESMDLLVKEAKAKGANAIINVKTSVYALPQDEYQMIHGITQFAYFIEGFAIKRINN